MWHFHFPDTSAYASGDSASSHLYTAARPEATSASATTVCATSAKGTTCDAKAFGNARARHIQTCRASATTKATNTGIHAACTASHRADRGITNVTDDARAHTNCSKTG